MRKSDLQTGMVIEKENGDKCMVLLGTPNGDIFSGHTWGPMSNIREDLTSIYNYFLEGVDVVKVYQPKTNMDYLEKPFSESNLELLWERDSVTPAQKKGIEEGDTVVCESALSGIEILSLSDDDGTTDPYFTVVKSRSIPAGTTVVRQLSDVEKL